MIVRSFKQLHNRRPILTTVIAFIMMIITVTVFYIWWNYLLLQNHHILRELTAAAKAAETNPKAASFPLAALMLDGMLCSLLILTGLIYMFLRLIKAVQLNLAQSQFISAVTHELRSPVAGIQLMLETIRDPSTPPDKRREFEVYMDSDLKRLKILVDQVLDTARLENFTPKAQNETITIAGFLNSCAELLETRLKTTDSTLKLPQLPSDLTMRGNRRLLMSAVSNILDNAIKYSSGPAEMSVEVEKKQASVVIEIHDRGIGISKKEQKRIFRRFYRAGDPLIQARTGTGLGLYFARLAVKTQGGKISVHSEGLGMGTSFKIEVPQS